MLMIVFVHIEFDEGPMRDKGIEAAKEIIDMLATQDDTCAPVDPAVHPLQYMFQTVWQRFKAVSWMKTDNPLQNRIFCCVEVGPNTDDLSSHNGNREIHHQVSRPVPHNSPMCGISGNGNDRTRN